MERLNNSELSPEQLEAEINRANAMSDLGKVIVDSAKTQVMAMKLMGSKGQMKTITEGGEEFTEATVVPLERPKAEYTNEGHDSLLKKYGA
jgi:hypothetical protein